MARQLMQPAFVLHARPFRESSLLLEAFTRDHGRIGLVARGARRGKSRWQNLLQPFRPLLLGWSRRGELGTLTGAEQVAAPPALVGDALYCGLYLNELTVRLLHRDDPHPEVFEIYRATLVELADGGALQRALRLFEKQLLEATGFGLMLEHEAGSQVPVDALAWYDYRPDQGPVRVSETASVQRGVVSGATLQALRSGELADEHLPALRYLMRRVIRHRLGDRPLASEALYRKSPKAGGRHREETP